MPAQDVTSYGVMSMHDIRERYLSFIAHTGSCARPKPSCRLGLNLVRQVFVDCCKSLLGRWPFPTLSLQSLRRCLDPYPAVSFQCICPLLPGRQRPHLKRHRFGTPKILPAMQLRQGSAFRGYSHSVMFRLPRSIDPQVAPTAEALGLQGGRAVYTTHSSVGYLPRDVASLRIRHGQLIRLDFHQNAGIIYFVIGNIVPFRHFSGKRRVTKPRISVELFLSYLAEKKNATVAT